MQETFPAPKINEIEGSCLYLIANPLYFSISEKLIFFPNLISADINGKNIFSKILFGNTLYVFKLLLNNSSFNGLFKCLSVSI